MLSAYVLIETQVGKVAHVAQALNDLDGVEEVVPVSVEVEVAVPAR
jgi:hypothetical protein